MKRLGAIVLFAGAVLISTHILAPAAAAAAAARTESRRSCRHRSGQARRRAGGCAGRSAARASGDVRRRIRRRCAIPSGLVNAPSRLRRRPACAGRRRAAAQPRARSAALDCDCHGRRLMETPVRTAVLALGDDLQIVKAGETYSKFVVRAINSRRRRVGRSCDRFNIQDFSSVASASFAPRNRGTSEPRNPTIVVQL